MLISTSLMVIIPGCVETIHQSKAQPPADDEVNGHTIVDFSLVPGFVLMYLTDQSSSFHAHQSQINDADFNDLDTRIGQSESNDEQYNVNHQHRTINPPSATLAIGLIVHAAADGIALGASVKHPEISMLVFIAIMLHKAPSPFALTSIFF